jgi:hypothetical protein
MAYYMRIWIFVLLLIKLAATETPEVLSKEQLTSFLSHIMAKCAERKVGLVEASAAVVSLVYIQVISNLNF